LTSIGASKPSAVPDEFFRNRQESCDECDGCWEGSSCKNPTDGEAGTDIRYIPIDQMRTIETDQLGRGLPPQNWEIARSFITPMMTKIGR
jgi:hypothetical protein